jgi:hypothetical protein
VTGMDVVVVDAGVGDMCGCDATEFAGLEGVSLHGRSSMLESESVGLSFGLVCGVGRLGW